MVDHLDLAEIVLVDQPEQVERALAELGGAVLGVDVERADADRYFRRAALVQVGEPGRCVLLDTVALDELPGLDELLDPGHTAVLHALENDLVPLRNLGVDPATIADTSVAAALLGLPTGLSGLLDEVLQVHLTDDKDAYQRADWSLRPLSEGMTAYAAGDVVHLPRLWEVLAERLETTGRASWYREELAATVHRAETDNRSWQRVKGAGRLDPQQRAVLRHLWEARERLARAHDIAPNRLVHDDVLRDLATETPRTEAQLVRRSPRRRTLLREHAPELFAALQQGLDASPERKDRSARWSDEQRTAHDALRQARAEVAEELGVDPGVLCPSRPLWDAIAGDPSDGRELCQLAGLRQWQTDLLADPLWDAYCQVGSGGGGGELPGQH